MVSASKAARQAKRAAEGKDPKKPSKTLKSKLDRSEPNSTDASKNASKASSVNGDVGESEAPMLDADEEFIDEKVKKLALQEDKDGLSDRVTTGPDERIGVRELGELVQSRLRPVVVRQVAEGLLEAGRVATAVLDLLVVGNE